MTIEFRQVPRYEGLYMVSNTGLVLSLGRSTVDKNGHVKTKRAKILKVGLDRDLYCYVSLYDENKRVSRKSVHSLVCLAFIGDRPNDSQINHINFDRQDNRLENLEYVSPSENVKHSVGSGTRSHLVGEDAPYSLMTEEKVLEARFMYKHQNVTKAEVARHFKISKGCVDAIIENKTWKHI